MIKKRYLLLIIIICFFAISTASAEEISDDANIGVNNYDSSLITESTDENLLTDSYGTFDELQDEIDAVEEGGTLNLKRDYKYVNDSSDKISITKAITIDGQGHNIEGRASMHDFLYISISVYGGKNWKR